MAGVGLTVPAPLACCAPAHYLLLCTPGHRTGCSRVSPSSLLCDFQVFPAMMQVASCPPAPHADERRTVRAPRQTTRWLPPPSWLCCLHGVLVAPARATYHGFHRPGRYVTDTTDVTDVADVTDVTWLPPPRTLAIDVMRPTPTHALTYPGTHRRHTNTPKVHQR